jgi:hypothetical protein
MDLVFLKPAISFLLNCGVLSISSFVITLIIVEAYRPFFSKHSFIPAVHKLHSPLFLLGLLFLLGINLKLVLESISILSNYLSLGIANLLILGTYTICYLVMAFLVNLVLIGALLSCKRRLNFTGLFHQGSNYLPMS